MSRLQKSRLGRGLNSLLNVTSLSPAEEAEIVAPPERLRPVGPTSSDPASIQPPLGPPPEAPIVSPIPTPFAHATPAAKPPAIAPPPILSDAKVQSDSPDSAPDLSVIRLAVESVRPNPHQPRKSFDDAQLAELAASLKTSGVIQPIVVRKSADGYELIAGERRLRAARLAGLSVIPAIVREADRFAQAQMALIENIQREDLNPIDRAAGYRVLIEQLGLTQAELATRLGEERSSIANFLRLLDLPDTVRQRIQDRALSMGHAKLLAGVDDSAEQERLATLVVSQELSVRNLERLLAGETVDSAPRTPSDTPGGTAAHLGELERAITRQLGLRAEIRSGAKGKGRVTIHFASLDEFDALLAKLGVSPDSV